jgi:hypothetical protein
MYGDEKSQEDVPIGVWIFHAVWAIAAVIGIAASILKGNPDIVPFT